MVGPLQREEARGGPLEGGVREGGHPQGHFPPGPLSQGGRSDQEQTHPEGVDETARWPMLMAEQHRGPGAGERSGTRVEARRRGPPPWAPAGALWLIVLIFHAACASQGPTSSRVTGGGRAGDEAAESEARAAPRELLPVLVVYATEVEARGRTRAVAVTREEYQRAVAQLLQHHKVHGMLQEAAQGLLQAMPEEELLAEVYRDRVLTLVPLTDKGSLVPEAEAALEAKYLRWCQPRGGGDCLGLFTDGPYLDRRVTDGFGRIGHAPKYTEPARPLDPGRERYPSGPR